MDVLTDTAVRSLTLFTVAIDGRIEFRLGDKAAAVEAVERSPNRFVYRHRDLHVFAFAFGAVVVVGTDRLDPDLRAFIERATSRQVLPETLDVYRVVTLSDPSSSARPRIDWDRIAVARIDAHVLEIVALLLARSAGLERYERAAEPLLEQGLQLAREFAGHGRTPWRATEMVRRIASLSVQRLELTRWFVHLDRPDLTWDDATIAWLYDGLADHLDLAERHEALMHRIGSLEESLSNIVRVWEGRRSRALEWAIVWLIVTEIVFALLHIV